MPQYLTVVSFSTAPLLLFAVRRYLGGSTSIDQELWTMLTRSSRDFAGIGGLCRPLLA